jgi:branched-chain amino acid transport system permease protein
VRGRPQLFNSYESEIALLNTPAKRVWVGVLLIALAAAPFVLVRELVGQLTLAFGAAIGAIGLNLVTGYAGQVSLGHAFFLGLGAYTASVLGGRPDFRVVGLEMDILVWLPAAGVVAAIAGLIVSPIAFRLRGLYLAIVTLGLVFIGEHIFREAQFITGGAGVGRASAVPALFGVSLDSPPTAWGISGQTAMYFLLLLVLIVMALCARNLVRGGVGRAFAAVRDRDVAAEIMGIPLGKYKALAFTVSSFYAGIAGALLFTLTGYIEPGSFGLLLSVQYIAMVLIGGVATISGSIMGAAFVSLLPRFVQELPRFLPFIEGGGGGGGFLTIQQVEQVLYGVLIALFVIFEPRGLFGLWVRFRNYWKAWPFSY